nr:alpha/beta hydrolase [Gordonia asplenii]
MERDWVALDSSTAARHGAGGHPCQGVYHRPAGAMPKTAMIAAHYAIDFSEHYLAEYMAQRGIGFLGWNTRFRGNEHTFLLDHALVDIGQGVRWLREQGVENVVLLGNSGGGSLMAAYQSQAKEANVRPLDGMRPATGVEDLPAADLYVSTAAHLGRPEVLTNWFDPSVTDENDPLATDPELSLFRDGRTPPFDAEFIDRYRAAQVARNHRITDWVKKELARVQEAGYHDRLFNLYRAWADPRMVDPSIEPTNREPNSCYAGVPARANYSIFGIAGTNSLRTWLSLWSLQDSQTSAAPHLGRITEPALVINADGDTGVFPSDAAAIVAALGSKDIQQHVISADHYFRRPNGDDGARVEMADLVAGWIADRLN